MNQTLLMRNCVFLSIIHQANSVTPRELKALVLLSVMARHQYITNSHNLFADDDEIDDETFLRNSRPKNVSRTNYGPAASYSSSSLSDLEAQRQTMLERQREIEQRTLDSSARSLGLLSDSEQIGIATAEELVKQREQLENTSNRLDEINSNLRFSQKHLNGIKSVFSSLKNYMSGKDQPPPRSVASDTQSIPEKRPFDESFDVPSGTASHRFDSHPSTRLRGLNGEDAARAQRHAGTSTESRRVNELLDANLDEMVTAISRLKGLGTQLGQEIEAQNELIDTIQDKAEVADITIGKQNKQMNKILGKQ